jgi:hypothetical protein
MKKKILFLGAIVSTLLVSNQILAVPFASSQQISQLETEVANPQSVIQEQFLDRSKFTGVAAEVDKIAQQITVSIDSKINGFGSGVIIAKQGNTYYVLTTDYRFKNPDEYTEYILVTPDGQSYPIDSSQITVLEGTGLAVVHFSSTQTYSVATLAKYNLGIES